jgi:hypothetical protein
MEHLSSSEISVIFTFRLGSISTRNYNEYHQVSSSRDDDDDNDEQDTSRTGLEMVSRMPSGNIRQESFITWLTMNSNLIVSTGSKHQFVYTNAKSVG